MCVDFRAVKKISVKNRYPIPCINDLLGYLKDANYFTNLDCEVVIIKFRLQKGDIWKNHFQNKEGFVWMVSDSFWALQCPNNFYAFDEWCLTKLLIKRELLLKHENSIQKTPKKHEKNSPKMKLLILHHHSSFLYIYFKVNFQYFLKITVP